MDRQSKGWDLYCTGKSLRQIAGELGVSHVTVKNDLAASRALWRETHPDKVDAWTTDQLARLDKIEQTAWAAWERSCQDAEIRRVSKETDGEGNPKEKSFVEKRGQSGDPRFLERVGWCIDRRCKLLGLDAAVRVDHTGNITLTHEYERLRSLPPEELVRLHKQSLGTASENRQ